jgi:hypothetical protein
MIKKEHIRQAIEAISRRDPEVGYTLDEMLSTGRIGLVRPRPDIRPGGDFQFLFDGRPVTIRRIVFFNAGTAPIEERLLIKYGEMARKQQLGKQSAGVNFREAAQDIRASGIRFMVRHEIDRVIARLERRMRKPDPGLDIPAAGTGKMDSPSEEADPCRQLIREFEMLKINDHDLGTYLPPVNCNSGADLCFQGAVNGETSAFFVRFPFCMDTLMKVADLNLEFFHVRFLLSCLSDGFRDHLFACVVDNRIEGMAYLRFKKSYFYRVAEIRYIATLRGRSNMGTDLPVRVVKGVGTHLLAGVWMVWKTRYRAEKDLLLDSEVGARSFYEAVGFQSRGFSEFVLKRPQGKLAKAILDMAARCPDLTGGVLDDIMGIVKAQLRILCKRGDRPQVKMKRQLALEAIGAVFKPGAHTTLAESAMRELIRYQKRIPESAELFRLAQERE